LWDSSDADYLDADPQITGMHDNVFCSYGMEKIRGLRSEFGRQLKKDKKPSGSSGGSVREWKFLKSLIPIFSLILDSSSSLSRKTVDNLAKPEETQV